MAEALNYLSSHVDNRMYALDFTTPMFNQLMEALEESFNKETLHYSMGSVRAAVQAYFKKTDQNIKLLIDDNGNITVLKEYDYPDGTQEYDRKIHPVAMLLVDANENLDDCKISCEVIKLPDALKKTSFKILATLHDDEKMQRDVLRCLMHKHLTIDGKDAIFFIKETIFIRKYIQRVSGISEKEHHYNSEEVMRCYSDAFPDGAWKDLESALEETIQDKLNFRRISNALFVKSYVHLFLSVTDIVVANALCNEECRGIAKGISQKVFKEYFDKMLYKCAIILLEYVKERDGNVEKFIKYYEDEVVMDHGKKFKKHAIVDDDGMKWNYSSILSVVMQYNQAKKKLDDIEVSMMQKKERMTSIKKALESQHTTLRKLEDQKLEIEEVMKQVNAERQQLNYAMRISRNKTETSQLRIKLSRINTQYTNSIDRLKIAQSHFNNQKNRVENNERELLGWQKHLQADRDYYKQISEQNKTILDSYRNIVKALGTAIAKK